MHCIGHGTSGCNHLADDIDRDFEADSKRKK